MFGGSTDEEAEAFILGMDPASHLWEVKYREEDVSVVDVGRGEYGEI